MAEASGDEDFAMDDAMGQNTTTEVLCSYTISLIHNYFVRNQLICNSLILVQEGPISSLESGYLVNKFDRPLPVKVSFPFLLARHNVCVI